MLTPEQERVTREMLNKLIKEPTSVSMTELTTFCDSIPLYSPRTGKPIGLTSYISALGMDWHPTKSKIATVLRYVLYQQDMDKKKGEAVS